MLLLITCTAALPSPVKMPLTRWFLTPSLPLVQDVIGVDAASDRAIAAALGRRIKQLLQPVHTRLYPQGPSNANLLEKLAERPSSARDKDREAKVCWAPGLCLESKPNLVCWVSGFLTLKPNFDTGDAWCKVPSSLV